MHLKQFETTDRRLSLKNQRANWKTLMTDLIDLFIKWSSDWNQVLLCSQEVPCCFKHIPPDVTIYYNR